MKVQKRDGRVVVFDKSKIVNAILKAFKEVDGDLSEYAYTKANNIADYIQKKCSEKEQILNIEDIQDYVESGLMSTKRKDVARAYIKYRESRNRIRESKADWMQQIAEKLKATNIQNQNANVDEASFGGRKGEVDSVLMKKLALEYIIPEYAAKKHLNNEIYIHDLDSYAVGMHNCLTIPFDDLLKYGFNTRQMDIRPASSVSSAFQLVAVIFQLQSLQQFGGASASHIDWTMVPYVRKSFYKHYKDGVKYFCEYDWNLNELLEDDEKYNNIIDIPINDYGYYINYPDDAGDYSKVYNYAIEMTEKEIHQAVEGMYHNLNTLQSRSGNQLPFTSINYGTCTLPEGRMVTKAILEESIKGGGNLHKTYIFPCGIFQCMKDVNRKPEDPNYDLFQLALKSTAQRLYPNYVNVDWSVNAGYDKNDPRTYTSTMGCRTYNGMDMNHDSDVHPQIKDGRGNICPVTIILPTLAMEATNRWTQNTGTADPNIIKYFMELLDQNIHTAKDMLIDRFWHIVNQSPDSAKFMYENHTMLGYDGKNVFSAMKHGTLALGQIGLAETLQILIGKDQTSKEGMVLAKEIEELFNKRCAEFKHEKHHDDKYGDFYYNFGVYYTPAENLCYTAMKKFQKKYGKLKNISDRDFFTNSNHVPVWKEVSPFEKIDIESQLTGYSNAGCITYVELDSGVKNNLQALETIVNYAMDKDIPYFAINVPNDTCLTCGYTDELNDSCPQCGGTEIQRLRRVTGYLTGSYLTAFNKGKIQEVQMRYKHSQKLENWNR